MLNTDIAALLGYNNNAIIIIDLLGDASNVILTDNPPFDLSDFSSVFPIFDIAPSANTTAEGQIPYEVFGLFKTMADAAIKYDRYFNNWKYFMCLYIAHFLTLYLQTQNGDASAANALKGAMPTGVATSKSVDGLSVSIDLMGVTDDLAGYGTWKLTVYGQQLATLTKAFGHAGMWVNG